METTTKKGESTCRADFASRTKLKSAMPFNKVLTDFMTGRNNKSLKELKGKISFRDDYDYKLMRS